MKEHTADTLDAIQVDPELGIHEIGAALVAGVEPGDKIMAGGAAVPRWWWQRRPWYRDREVRALERIAIVLELAVQRQREQAR